MYSFVDIDLYKSLFIKHGQIIFQQKALPSNTCTCISSWKKKNNSPDDGDRSN